MDPRIIYALASQPPEARIATAIRANIPLEALHQIEMVALANGIELVGGPATAVEEGGIGLGGGGGGIGSGGGGSGGTGGGGGGGEDAAPPGRWSDEMKVSLQVVREEDPLGPPAAQPGATAQPSLPPPASLPPFLTLPSPSVAPFSCRGHSALGDDLVQGVELRRRGHLLPGRALYALLDQGAAAAVLGGAP
jgi:hypothetical protein